MTMENSVKTSQALELMSSLERLKNEKRFCNFIIKVGTESFSVDCNVLAASSVYFGALFSSGMREVHKGFIEMKFIDANAIKICIEFMYTGEAKIEMETIHHTMHACNLLQLTGLIKLCFEFLRKSLNPQNSINVLWLSETYNNEELKMQALAILTSKFQTVIHSKVFPHISKQNLLHYIQLSNPSYKIKWQALLTWSSKKRQHAVAEQFLLEFLTELRIEDYPISFLVKTMLQEPLVRKSRELTKYIHAALFSDAIKLEKNINDAAICYQLKNMTDTLDKFLMDCVLIRLFAKNFADVVKVREFCDLTSDFVAEILKKTQNLEQTKYEAILKWTKHDLKNRKTLFSKFFAFIELKKFPLHYLKNNVRTESLVKDSRKCCDMLMDAVFTISENNGKSITVVTRCSATIHSSDICFSCGKSVWRRNMHFLFKCCDIDVHESCLLWSSLKVYTRCPKCHAIRLR